MRTRLQLGIITTGLALFCIAPAWAVKPHKYAKKIAGAAVKNNLAKVDKYLKKGGDISGAYVFIKRKAVHRWSPLFACLKRYPSCRKETILGLLERGASPSKLKAYLDEDGGDPVWHMQHAMLYALEQGHLELARYFIDGEVWAPARLGNLDWVREGVEKKGGDVNLERVELRMRRDKVIWATQAFTTRQKPLYTCAASKDCPISIIRYLMKKGARPWGIQSQKEERFRMPSERHRESSERFFQEEVGRDYSGMHLLHIAAAEGRLDILEYLLGELQLDPNLRARNEKNNTPLLAAARFGQGESITLLLAVGADPEARNSEGFKYQQALVAWKAAERRRARLRGDRLAEYDAMWARRERIIGRMKVFAKPLLKAAAVGAVSKASSAMGLASNANIKLTQAAAKDIFSGGTGNLEALGREAQAEIERIRRIRRMRVKPTASPAKRSAPSRPSASRPAASAPRSAAKPVKGGKLYYARSGTECGIVTGSLERDPLIKSFIFYAANRVGSEGNYEGEIMPIRHVVCEEYEKHPSDFHQTTPEAAIQWLQDRREEPLYGNAYRRSLQEAKVYLRSVGAGKIKVLDVR